MLNLSLRARINIVARPTDAVEGTCATISLTPRYNSVFPPSGHSCPATAPCATVRRTTDISTPSATSRMTPRFGIDTSIFVRLWTGNRAASFKHCVRALAALIRPSIDPPNRRVVAARPR